MRDNFNTSSSPLRPPRIWLPPVMLLPRVSSDEERQRNKSFVALPYSVTPVVMLLNCPCKNQNNIEIFLKIKRLNVELAYNTWNRKCLYRSILVSLCPKSVQRNMKQMRSNGMKDTKVLSFL